MSVEVFTFRDENCVGERREDDTTDKGWEGESECRLHLKATGKGVGGAQAVSCRLKVLKK